MAFAPGVASTAFAPGVASTASLLDALVVVTVAVVGLVYGLNRFDVAESVRYVLAVAFGLRVLYAFVADYWGVFAGRYDFGKFDAALWAVARGFRTLDLGPFLRYAHAEPFYPVYTLTFSPLYALFGHETILVRLLMALVGTLFVYNVYRLARTVGTRRTGLYAAGFAAVFPYWIYLSGIFYRDTLVLLALSQSLYATVRWQVQDRTVTRAGLSMLAVTILAGSLRIENFVALGAMLAVAVLLKYDDTSLATRLAGAAVAGGALFVAFLTAFRQALDFDYLRSQRLSLTSGSAAYLPHVVYRTPIELLSYLPVGICYFLLVPFPWQVHSFKALLAFAQNVLLWYPALIVAVVGVRDLLFSHRDATLVMAAYAAVGVVSYAAVEGNVGPAIRHRSQFQLCVVVFAAVGFVRLIDADCAVEAPSPTSEVE
ncbi:MAG: glycosyltransferase family 39 protein [Haloplanus sp.]